MEFMRLDTERKNPPPELQRRSRDSVLCHMMITWPSLDMVHFTDEEMYARPARVTQSLLQPEGSWGKCVGWSGEGVMLLPWLQRLDYLSYLQSFDRLFDIPKERKSLEYRRWSVGCACVSNSRVSLCDKYIRSCTTNTYTVHGAPLIWVALGQKKVYCFGRCSCFRWRLCLCTCWLTIQLSWEVAWISVWISGLNPSPRSISGWCRHDIIVNYVVMMS